LPMIAPGVVGLDNRRFASNACTRRFEKIRRRRFVRRTVRRIEGCLCYNLTPGHASPSQRQQQPRRTPAAPAPEASLPGGNFGAARQAVCPLATCSCCRCCLLLTGHAHTTTINLTGYHTVLLCALAHAGRASHNSQQLARCHQPLSPVSYCTKKKKVKPRTPTP
jgi:hypothetical protein